MNLPILIVACLTLGLAPFMPEPHLWEKLKMLTSGELAKPVDIFAVPWVGPTQPIDITKIYSNRTVFSALKILFSYTVREV